MRNSDNLYTDEDNETPDSNDDTDILQLYLENKIDFQKLGTSLNEANISNDIPSESDFSVNTLFKEPDTQTLPEELGEYSGSYSIKSSEDITILSAQTAVDNISDSNIHNDTNTSIDSEVSVHNNEDNISKSDTYTNDNINELVNAINHEESFEQDLSYIPLFDTNDKQETLLTGYDNDITITPLQEEMTTIDDAHSYVEEDITKIESSWNRLSSTWENIIQAPEIKSQIEHLWSSIRNKDNYIENEQYRDILPTEYVENNDISKEEHSLNINDTVLFYENSNHNSDNQADSKYIVIEPLSVPNSDITDNDEDFLSRSIHGAHTDIQHTKNEYGIDDSSIITAYSEHENIEADSRVKDNEDGYIINDSDDIDDIVNKILNNDISESPSKIIHAATHSNHNKVLASAPSVITESVITQHTTHNIKKEKHRNYNHSNISYLIYALIITTLLISIYEITEYSSNHNSSNPDNSPTTSTNTVNTSTTTDSYSSAYTSKVDTDKSGEVKNSTYDDKTDTVNISASSNSHDNNKLSSPLDSDLTIYDNTQDINDTKNRINTTNTSTNNDHEYYTPPSELTHKNDKESSNTNIKKPSPNIVKNNTTTPTTKKNVYLHNKWSLNLESIYNNRESAEKELSTLLNKNINAEIIEIVVDDSKWYRILIKGFESKQDAIDYMDTVRENSHYSRYWISKSN